MKTLLQRLKPEVKAALENNEPKYSGSVRSIFAKLDSTSFYGDLTISDVRSLYTFANIDSMRVSTWDFKYGDNILINDDE